LLAGFFFPQRAAAFFSLSSTAVGLYFGGFLKSRLTLMGDLVGWYQFLIGA
jgi:hypothetical protein